MEDLGGKALRGRLVGALTYCTSLRCSIVDMKLRENARSLITVLCHIASLVKKKKHNRHRKFLGWSIQREKRNRRLSWPEIEGWGRFTVLPMLCPTEYVIMATTQGQGRIREDC